MIIKKKLPDFNFENKLWDKGFEFVAGADEVGRGSFAGPVVAACVVFSTLQGLPFKGSTLQGGIVINDSKKLTKKQRELADMWIRKNALSFGIGMGSVTQINNLGIKNATHVAYRKAVRNTEVGLQTSVVSSKSIGAKKLKADSRQLISIDHLLVDAFFIPSLRNLRVGTIKKYEHNNTSKVRFSTKQTAIVGGDQICFSIAAASIIAKVYRDNLMKELGLKKNFKIYNWGKNKGYGTATHRAAIIKFGQSKHHRRDFIKSS